MFFSEDKTRNDFLASLASGHGDGEVIRLLASGQVGKRMLQLHRAIMQAQRAPSAIEAVRAKDNYTLLTEIQRVDPQVIRSLLLNPDVGMLLSAQDSRNQSLGPITAAAAIMAGASASVIVPVDRGTIFLPGLGTARLSRAGELRHATVLIGPAGISVTASGEKLNLPGNLETATRQWSPARYLVIPGVKNARILYASEGPINDAFGTLYSPDPQAENKQAEWQHALEEAWAIIEEIHPPLAGALAEGARAIIPLARAKDGGMVSGTLGQVFGAMGLALPSKPEIFALTLVHELQHSKLAAALDFIPMYSPDDQTTYYAPWRPDPRPLGALLHGIYAHIAIADFWNVQRRASGSCHPLLAHVEFVRSIDACWLACQQIHRCPTLIGAGIVFADELMAKADRLRAESVPAEARAIANRIAREHDLTWRVHNRELSGTLARTLAASWLAGDPPSTTMASSIKDKSKRVPISDRRTRARTFYELLEGTPADTPSAFSRPGDEPYLHGDFKEAYALYKARIVDDPDDLDAWTGLALSAEEDSLAQAALCSIPEVAAAVYREATLLRPGVRDIDGLLRWMANAA